MPKVGDKAWLWDTNRREYVPGKVGPTPRGHFSEVKITGETRASWIVDRLKFEKETGRYRDSDYSSHLRLFFTKESVDDYCFVTDHFRDILDAVRDCRDAAKLRQIAAILGVDVIEGGSNG